MPSVSFSCFGWPGIKAASITGLMSVVLGPGAILVIVLSHDASMPHSGDAVAEVGYVVDAIGRVVGCLVCAIFSLYGLILVKRWATRYIITCQDDRLVYAQMAFGHRTSVSIPYQDLVSITPYLEPGLESHGYVIVAMRSQRQTNNIRLITRSFDIAQMVAMEVRQRIPQVP